MKKLLAAILLTFSGLAAAYPISNGSSNGTTDIWPNIPFVRGADLCKFSDAYGKTRSEYMKEMVGLAKDLMQAGAFGSEAVDMLEKFNNLYDRNQALATRGNGLGMTFESTLKSYIDSYYRSLRPRKRKIIFRNYGDIVGQVNSLNTSTYRNSFPSNSLENLDFIAYGTYALAPNCRGNIQVTIHLVGKDGAHKSYIGKGKPEVVMSQIASQLFEDFQRTQFPSQIRVGNKNLTLVGALNGSVTTTSSPRNAQFACETLNARLPNRFEIEVLDSYGDWSGGVSLGNGGQVWAMPNNMVYHPGLRNPTPVREPWEVNAKIFHYYCVR